MPSYGGGKAKLGKEITEVIQEIEENENWDGDFFEPFCGLLGVGIHIIKNNKNRNRKVIACDANKDIIMMWKALQRGWIPPISCTKKKYNELKHSTKHSAERGFIGVACAYSGIFFAGYRPTSNSQNFFKNTRTGLLNMVPYLTTGKIKFLPATSYSNFNPKGLTIYCDPPYKNNNLGGEYFSNFNNDKFWSIMKKWSKNNLVIISEYTAPKDFECVWDKNVASVYSGKRKKNTEKLFMYKYGL
jgi:DNA adenine methylase